MSDEWSKGVPPPLAAAWEASADYLEASRLYLQAGLLDQAEAAARNTSSACDRLADLITRESDKPRTTN